MNLREKEHMMRNVQMYSLAALEAAMFLSAHPHDKTALDYYNKYNKMQKKATEDYEKKYGPINRPGEEKSGQWKWATEQWPWEVEY